MFHLIIKGKQVDFWPRFKGTQCVGCFSVFWKFTPGLWWIEPECCFSTFRSGSVDAEQTRTPERLCSALSTNTWTSLKPLVWFRHQICLSLLFYCLILISSLMNPVFYLCGGGLLWKCQTVWKHILESLERSPQMWHIISDVSGQFAACRCFCLWKRKRRDDIGERETALEVGFLLSEACSNMSTVGDF